MMAAAVRSRIVVKVILALLCSVVAPRVNAVRAGLANACGDEDGTPASSASPAASTQLTDLKTKVRQFAAMLRQPDRATDAKAPDRTRTREERGRLLALINGSIEAIDAEQFEQAGQLLQQAIAQTESDATREALNSLLTSVTAVADEDRASFVARVHEVATSFAGRLVRGSPRR